MCIAGIPKQKHRACDMWIIRFRKRSHHEVTQFSFLMSVRYQVLAHSVPIHCMLFRIICRHPIQLVNSKESPSSSHNLNRKLKLIPSPSFYHNKSSNSQPNSSSTSPLYWEKNTLCKNYFIKITKLLNASARALQQTSIAPYVLSTKLK